VVESLEGLASLLAAHAKAGARVFGLDGADGSGKSSTAKELHALLGWPVVHVDEFLSPDRGAYVPHLDAEAIAKQVRKSDTPTLVEGVCLLAVAARADFKLDVHVYIKRLSRFGRWADADECEYEGDPEAHITKLEAEYAPLLRVFAEPGGAAREPELGLTEFRKEVIRYHGLYRPANSADHVYCRAEPGV